MDYKYDAFISFAWKDLARARRLQRRLAEKGYATWYAEKNMRAGDVLLHKISDGMTKSRYLLVIHSKHYAGGKWAQMEIAAVMNNEIKSGLTKVVCLKFDDTELPMILDAKLYIDFRQRRPDPLERLCAVLDEASGLVIEGVKSAFLAATDVNEIREYAHRLSRMARHRNELAALNATAEILLSVPENYNVGDSAAWAMGDIGVWSDSQEMAQKIMETVPRVIATADARLINHMAHICGEMELQARNSELKRWAAAAIDRHAADPDPSVSAPFAATKKRVRGD
jgi:hypothetical protein